MASKADEATASGSDVTREPSLPLPPLPVSFLVGSTSDSPNPPAIGTHCSASWRPRSIKVGMVWVTSSTWLMAFGAITATATPTAANAVIAIAAMANVRRIQRISQSTTGSRAFARMTAAASSASGRANIQASQSSASASASATAPTTWPEIRGSSPGLRRSIWPSTLDRARSYVRDHGPSRLPRYVTLTVTGVATGSRARGVPG